MYQVNLSLPDSQIEFLGRHRDYGFRDRSELVRRALEYFQRQIELTELDDSANLYAQLYAEDPQSQEWVADSSKELPH